MASTPAAAKERPNSTRTTERYFVRRRASWIRSSRSPSPATKRMLVPAFQATRLEGEMMVVKLQASGLYVAETMMKLLCTRIPVFLLGIMENNARRATRKDDMRFRRPVSICSDKLVLGHHT